MQPGQSRVVPGQYDQRHQTELLDQRGQHDGFAKVGTGPGEYQQRAKAGGHQPPMPRKQHTGVIANHQSAEPEVQRWQKVLQQL